mgnify:FL=1
MANWSEVQKAVNIFKKTKSPLLVFQCTSNYPSKLKNSNLAVIKEFSKKFNCPVGLSDHTQSILPAIIATSLGAVAIEKHFTLSRNLPGIDQKASLEPKELKLLVEKCREVKLALGDKIKKPTPEELNSIKTIRRSLIINRDLKKGTIIKKNMIEIKRPGTGIKPENYNKIIGMKLTKNKKNDEIIFWKDLK